LGVSGQRVHQLCLEGKLNPLTTRLGRLFDREEVERLRDERRAQAEQDMRVKVAAG
jgi:hypothetical protein